MTLILALASSDAVVLLADRRLTQGGMTVESRETKLTYLVCNDAAVGVAFTGFASTPGLNTADWLRTTLANADPPELNLDSIVEHTRTAASTRFRTFRTPLTFAFVGWSDGSVDGGDDVVPICRIRVISNMSATFGVQPSFRLAINQDFPLSPREKVFQAWGSTSGLRHADLAGLKRLVEERRPPIAWVEKGADVMRETAASRASHGYVGRDYLSLVLSSTPDAHPTFGFHPAEISSYSDVVNIAVALEGTGRIEGRGFTTTHQVIPTTRKRSPCPCGSGRRFKACHGRHGRRGGYTVALLRENAAITFAAQLGAESLGRLAFEVSLATTARREDWNLTISNWHVNTPPDATPDLFLQVL